MTALRILPTRSCISKPSHNLASHHNLSRLTLSSCRHQVRTFLPFPSSFSPLSATSTPTQSLTASRTLPYPSNKIYAIIADVESYSAFLPFCSRSTVTRWSAPDSVTGARWPSEAELEVGWKGISEQFTSRIYCVPGRVVEAVGGATDTTLPKAEIDHHFANGQKESKESRDGSVLSHLSTMWTVKDAASGKKGEETDVHLAIEFQFANPIYSAMSSAVADRVAGYMIEAFESRVREVLGKERR